MTCAIPHYTRKPRQGSVYSPRENISKRTKPWKTPGTQKKGRFASCIAGYCRLQLSTCTLRVGITTARSKSMVEARDGSRIGLKFAEASRLENYAKMQKQSSMRCGGWVWNGFPNSIQLCGNG